MRLLPLALQNVLEAFEVQKSNVLTTEEVQVKRATVGIKSARCGGGERGLSSNHAPQMLFELIWFTVFHSMWLSEQICQKSFIFSFAFTYLFLLIPEEPLGSLQICFFFICLFGGVVAVYKFDFVPIVDPSDRLL